MDLPAAQKLEESNRKIDDRQSQTPDNTGVLDTFPNKVLVGLAILAWSALFHVSGVSTLGYGSSNSIFDWLRSFYTYAWIKDTDDQICFVAPVAVAIIFISRADEILRVPRRLSFAGLAILALALALHLGGYVVQQTRLSIAGYIIGIYGIMGIFWGIRWLKAIAFPYVLLFFCIPASAYLDSLTFQLRLLSAAASAGIAKIVFNIPIERTGTLVFHPATAAFSSFQFDVAPACSGIRSMAVVLLMAVTCSFLFLRPGWPRLVVIGASPLLALAGNITRLVTTFFVADIGGEQAGKAVEHNGGFVTFSVAIAAIGLLIKWLPGRPKPETATDRASSPPMPGANRSAPYFCFAAVLGLSALGAGSLDRLKSTIRLGSPGVRVVNEPVHDETGAIARTNAVFLPESIPGYSSEAGQFTATEFNYLPPDTTFGKRIYKSADETINATASIVLMGTDRISIHKPEFCLTGVGWHIRQNATTLIPLADGSLMEANRFDMVHDLGEGRSGQIGGIYVFWFVADGVRTASHSVREWGMFRSILTGSPVQRWAYISFFVPCIPGAEESAFQKLSQLIRLAQPRIEQGTVKTLSFRAGSAKDPSAR